MKTIKPIILLFSIILLSCLASALEKSTISINPPVTTVSGANKEFTIDITIDPKDYEVYGFQYTIYYDSSKLEVISQDPGTFLSSDGTSTYIINKITEPGKIEYGETRLNVQTGVTQQGLGAAIRFKTKVNSGTLSLDLRDVIKITYVDGNSLEYFVPDEEDGTIIIGENNDIEAAIAKALNYLKAQQSSDGSLGDTEWVIMAVAAADENPDGWKKCSDCDSLVDYLKNNGDSFDAVTDLEKYILAIAAADMNPYSFNGKDYVDDLKDEFDGEQIGNSDLLNDDYWGVIALMSAGIGENDNIISKTIQHIKDNQQPDGSWGVYIGSGGDTDDTAAAIMALLAAGESSGSSAVSDGFDFIKSIQNTDGGFGSGELAGAESNAGSTTWAISALYAAEECPESSTWTKNGNTPIDFLLALQREDGGFDWKDGISGMGFTEEAVTSLSKKYYPVKKYDDQTGIDQYVVYMRIEGQTKTLFAGDIFFKVPYTHKDDWSSKEVTWNNPFVSAAIETVDDKYDLDGDSINDDEIYTKDKWGGYFIQMIADEWNEGSKGWMYRIDYYSPDIGADAFEIDKTTPPSTPHNEILLYYGDWNTKPLRISADKAKADVGEKIRVKVEYYDDEDWLPLSSAAVKADNEFTTDAEGKVDIQFDHPGLYEIFAEKEGYIRSDKVSIEIEGSEEDSAEIDLEAVIVPAISISVTPDKLGFGNIGIGHNKEGEGFYITNKGCVDIDVTVQVKDDSSSLFEQSLYLHNYFWKDFHTIVDSDAEDWSNREGPYSTELRVPKAYSGMGLKKASLIFWAESAE